MVGESNLEVQHTSKVPQTIRYRKRLNLVTESDFSDSVTVLWQILFRNSRYRTAAIAAASGCSPVIRA